MGRGGDILLIDENHAAVVFKVPRDLIGKWILYCRRHGKTQSRVIREAIAYFIDNDNSVTDDELVMAARFADYGYGYDPRGPAEQ